MSQDEQSSQSELETADAGAQQRARAKQAEMLAVDEDYAEQWLATMRELVARELDDLDFTAARMEALKEWERARKLAQARLRYRYDPKRRPKRLIDATANRSVPEMKADLKARLDKARKATGPMPPKKSLVRDLEAAARLSLKENPVDLVAAGKARTLRAASELLSTVAVKTGIEDLSMASDLDIGGALSDIRPPVGDVNAVVRQVRNALEVLSQQPSSSTQPHLSNSR